MKLITDFKIKIPQAFRSAIDSCKFNEGDVIHDHESAYTSLDWKTSQQYLSHSIMITSTTQSSKRKKVQNAFKSNWHLPITVEVYDHNTKTSTHYHATHGSIFRYLETKDIQHITNAKQSTPPLELKDIKKMLRTVEKKHLITPISNVKNHQTTYIIPHCTTSERSIKKLNDITKSLKPFNPTIFVVNSIEAEIILREKITTTILKSDQKQYQFHDLRLKPTIKLIYITVSSQLALLPNNTKQLILSDEALRFCLDTTKFIKHHNCRKYTDHRLQKNRPFNLSNHLIKVEHNYEL